MSGAETQTINAVSKKDDNGKYKNDKMEQLCITNGVRSDCMSISSRRGLSYGRNNPRRQHKNGNIHILEKTDL
jgi:hypothetical protein